MTLTVCADEIRPGDVIRYCGRPYRISAVLRRSGWAWPVAIDGSGWAIALDHHVVNVARD